MDRRFHVLAGAYGVSSFGNFLNLIALSLFSYHVTGTAFGVGAIMALRLLAGFLAGFLAGACAGRMPGRRALMVGTDLAQAAAMILLALCAERSPLWITVGVVVVMGAGNTLFSVALRSAVPVMVGQDARARANGLLVAWRSMGTVLGFASAAPVIGIGGYGAAFAVNAASFLLSAAALLVLRPRTDGEESPSSALPSAQAEPSRSPVAPSGLRLLLGLPALLAGMVLLRGVDALASSSHNVALPVVAHSAAPGEPAVFMTRFWAAWAVGTVLAHLVLRRRRGEAAWGPRAFALGTCAMAVSFVAAFVGLPAYAVVLAALSAGFADGWTEIVYTSRLQATADRERGRLFGLSAAAEQSGFAIGTVAAASALEALPALAVVGAFHGAAVCGALVLLSFTVGRPGTAGSHPSATPAEAAEEEAGGTETQRTKTERTETEGKDTHGTRTGASSLQGSRAGPGPRRTT